MESMMVLMMVSETVDSMDNMMVAPKGESLVLLLVFESVEMLDSQSAEKLEFQSDKSMAETSDKRLLGEWV
jgi:hypothetical protein